MARLFFSTGGEAVPELRRRKPEAANPGLVWDCYLPLWERVPSAWAGQQADSERAKLKEPLDDFVRGFKSAGRYLDENRQLHVDRRQGALKHLAAVRGGACSEKVYQLVWRLATGLGADHPTDNGFAFDGLTGVPYITGSAVKGLCRRATDLTDICEGKVERLFGPDRITDVESGFQGALVFHDAFPASWPTLNVDLINCHHPGYYRNPEEGRGQHAQPLETENPVPVFFLTVAAGTRFEFPISGKSQADVDQAFKLLELGFEWLGIGAKTAVGYGEFKLAEVPTQPSLAQLKAGDPLQEFTDWFAKQGFAQGRNKGQLSFVRQQVCRLPVQLRSAAIEHVANQMRKALKASELQALLEKLRQPCG